MHISGYSDRRLFTGFSNATFMVWKLTVSSAMADWGLTRISASCGLFSSMSRRPYSLSRRWIRIFVREGWVVVLQADAETPGDVGGSLGGFVMKPVGRGGRCEHHPMCSRFKTLASGDGFQEQRIVVCVCEKALCAGLHRGGDCQQTEKQDSCLHIIRF